MTLGLGSFDGLLGTGFYARWQRLFLTGTMQYAVRTEGDFGYQFANDWTWLGGPGVSRYELTNLRLRSRRSLMPALVRGKKLLVVGDHKQVSPSAVGIARRRSRSCRGAS